MSWHFGIKDHRVVCSGGRWLDPHQLGTGRSERSAGVVGNAVRIREVAPLDRGLDDLLNGDDKGLVVRDRFGQGIQIPVLLHERQQRRNDGLVLQAGRQDRGRVGKREQVAQYRRDDVLRNER